MNQPNIKLNEEALLKACKKSENDAKYVKVEKLLHNNTNPNCS